MTEEHAIALCLQHRDPVGFEHLVSTYRREALMHAHALLGNAADAADACQECFNKAFAAMPTLKTLDRFYPWFYRILRNHCLNQIARRKVRAAYATRQIPAEFSAGPAFIAETRDDHRSVHRALAQLRPVHREILVMKYFDELHYDDIAERLGIPRGTVMSRLYYARRAFKTEFERQS